MQVLRVNQSIVHLSNCPFSHPGLIRQLSDLFRIDAVYVCKRHHSLQPLVGVRSCKDASLLASCMLFDHHLGLLVVVFRLHVAELSRGYLDLLLVERRARENPRALQSRVQVRLRDAAPV